MCGTWYNWYMFKALIDDVPKKTSPHRSSNTTNRVCVLGLGRGEGCPQPLPNYPFIYFDEKACPNPIAKHHHHSTTPPCPPETVSSVHTKQFSIWKPPPTASADFGSTSLGYTKVWLVHFTTHPGVAVCDVCMLLGEGQWVGLPGRSLVNIFLFVNVLMIHAYNIQCIFKGYQI